MSRLGKHKVDVLISEERIQGRIAEMGAMLTKEYEGRRPLLICILKGGVPFLVDLMREVDLPLEIDFLQVSSYGTGKTSSGEVRLDKDLGTPLEGRHVLVVEDIVDTGRTLAYLLDLLRRRNPADLRLCTLLDKPSRRVVPVDVDYIGFTIDDHFVVGYGLDYAEEFRNLPYIGLYVGEEE